MTRITKITACLICICAVFGTASCGKKASLPDVRDLGQILTVSREEGSGTRTEFDTNLKVTEQNADQVVSSTKDMLKTVASTKNAIGYVAYSAITADDKTDKLSLSRQTADYKMIKVDGVEVSDKTIRSGKYALCRDYYVAYKGKLNRVEQDFLRYIMSAGQKEVDKICVGKKKAADGYHLPGYFSARRIFHRSDREGTFDIYRMAGTEDYYLFGTVVTKSPELRIADASGSPLRCIAAEMGGGETETLYLYAFAADCAQFAWLQIGDEQIALLKAE